MGGGTSAQSNPFTHHIVMPPYYIEDAFLSEEEMTHIRESWQLIMDDKAAGYLKSKEEGDLSEEHSGVVFFYESFYKRLFDVHPSSRTLFQSNLDKMGAMLVGMLTSAVSLLNNISELAPRLEGLAKMHSKKVI
jgi:sulfur relay (sulfurtransferase) DsrC/TusE family protein